MSNVDKTTSRSSFFPNSRDAQVNKAKQLRQTVLKRNDINRRNELNKISKEDAKVEINDAIKDFSRIKKAVDASPPIDNSEKIARLKGQIEAGTYEIDFEKLADKMLEMEF